MSTHHEMRGEDLYCKLFVAHARDPDALTTAVGQITGGDVMLRAGLIDTPVLSMSVHTPSRHLPLNDEQDDFVYWRHFIDIDAANAQTGFDAFFSEVLQLVLGLRGLGLRVVAACDFEDELNAAAQAG